MEEKINFELLFLQVNVFSPNKQKKCVIIHVFSSIFFPRIQLTIMELCKVFIRAFMICVV